MSTVVFTTADRDALKAALVSGTLSVKIGDRQVTYRSQKDIIEALRMVDQYLSGTSTSETTNPSVIQATFNKGRS